MSSCRSTNEIGVEQFSSTQARHFDSSATGVASNKSITQSVWKLCPHCRLTAILDGTGYLQKLHLQVVIHDCKDPDSRCLRIQFLCLHINTDTKTNTDISSSLRSCFVCTNQQKAGHHTYQKEMPRLAGKNGHSKYVSKQVCKHQRQDWIAASTNSQKHESFVWVWAPELGCSI